jgi:hypothetical protein
MRHLQATFTLHDEIYQIKDFSRDNVRVLLRLDANKVDLSKKGVHREDKDFAVIWARDYDKGRVLYNGLGIVKKSGSGLIYKRCGGTWYYGPWAISAATGPPDPRRHRRLFCRHRSTNPETGANTWIWPRIRCFCAMSHD